MGKINEQEFISNNQTKGEYHQEACQRVKDSRKT